MDTYEARRQMRDLAQDTLDLVDEVNADEISGTAAATELRKMEMQARALVPDAGYPGETAWRGLQRAGIAMSAGERDAALVTEVTDALEEAIHVLDSLTVPGPERDSDFTIIG